MKSELFPYRAVFNFSIPHLRVAMLQMEPFVYKKKVGDYVEAGGPVSQVGAAIQAITGHKFSVVSVKDMHHGHRLENGSFVGVMGLFQRGEIDILLSPGILNEERSLLVEGATYDITTYRLLTWSPSKVVDPFNFASSFTLEVWATALLSFLTFSLICWFIGRFLTPWDAEKISLSGYTWDLFSRFFPQDPPDQKSAWFRMCLIGHLFAFSVLFMTFLSSALTSSMTIKSNEDFVDSYADVLRFPKVRLYSERGTVLTQIFTDPHNDLFRKLNSRLIPVRGIFSLDSKVMGMVSEVESKTRVIVGSPEMVYSMIMKKQQESGRCPKVTISSESAGLMIVSIFMSRNLSKAVRELIHRAVSVSFGANFYHTNLRWAVKDYDKCRWEALQSLSDTTEPLSLADVQGSFVLLSIGVGAASILFFLELSNERFCSRSKNIS